MDWLTLAELALWISAITVAATNARDYDWGRRKAVGVAVFLLGAGAVLFGEDVATTVGLGAALPAEWDEIAGIAAILVGGAVVLTARLREPPPE